MSYTRPIFTIGERYRAKKDFVSSATSFVAGEILVFDRNAYSHYDNSFVYEFKAESDGRIKEWWLHENRPAESWKEYFEPVGLAETNGTSPLQQKGNGDPVSLSTSVTKRKKAPKMTVILRGLPKGFDWGWYSREDPRMHLQIVD